MSATTEELTQMRNYLLLSSKHIREEIDICNDARDGASGNRKQYITEQIRYQVGEWQGLGTSIQILNYLEPVRNLFMWNF